jgi:hypothetical protein
MRNPSMRVGFFTPEALTLTLRSAFPCRHRPASPPANLAAPVQSIEHTLLEEVIISGEQDSPHQDHLLRFNSFPKNKEGK